MKEEPAIFQGFSSIFESGSFEKQQELFKKHCSALEIDLIVGYRELGNLYMLQGKADRAIGYFKKALSRAPGLPSLHYSLAGALRYLQNYEMAAFCYQSVLEKDPSNLVAKYGLALCHLPVFFEKASDLAISQEQYEKSLVELQKSVEAASQEQLAFASDAVGHFYPYYLPYQGLDVSRLQQIHGQISAKLMQAAYPHRCLPLKMPTLAPGERLKVGFVSSFFRQSSVWRIPLRGLIETIDRSQFETFGYSVNKLEDDQTQLAKSRLDHFIQESNFESMSEQIRSANLHALIISDVGMDHLSTRLASLRLAPIQLTGLGHPVTTGLPTIDYFLSSEWMEPEGAQAHYSEQLVSLPGLGVHYTPADLPKDSFDLSAFGARASSVKYLCGQSLFKYLPQDDALLTAIAKGVRDSQFIFIDWPKEVSAFFKKRFEKAFVEEGLDPKEHLLFVPRMSASHYRDLCRKCDLFLDTIGWSGFNSSLEALQQQLPVITLPGPWARGRHTLALCKGMELMEMVASSREEYVQKAIDWALNSSKRQALREKIGDRYKKLLGDASSTRHLEDFLKKTCLDRLSSL